MNAQHMDGRQNMTAKPASTSGAARDPKASLLTPSLTNSRDRPRYVPFDETDMTLVVGKAFKMMDGNTLMIQADHGEHAGERAGLTPPPVFTSCV
jgi:hypothetical protein